MRLSSGVAVRLLKHRARNRHAALHEALTHVAADGQRLIALLIADPPLPYAEISAGPSNRGRCLDEMHRYPTSAALINSEKDQQWTVNHLRS